jgi:hypothetical protein
MNVRCEMCVTLGSDGADLAACAAASAWLRARRRRCRSGVSCGRLTPSSIGVSLPDESPAAADNAGGVDDLFGVPDAADGGERRRDAIDAAHHLDVGLGQTQHIALIRSLLDARAVDGKERLNGRESVGLLVAHRRDAKVKLGVRALWRRDKRQRTRRTRVQSGSCEAAAAADGVVGVAVGAEAAVTESEGSSVSSLLSV